MVRCPNKASNGVSRRQQRRPVKFDDQLQQSSTLHHAIRPPPSACNRYHFLGRGPPSTRNSGLVLAIAKAASLVEAPLDKIDHAKRKPLAFDFADFAQEFLRRNPRYRAEYRSIMQSGALASADRAKAEMARTWGLAFPIQSGSRCRASAGTVACLGRADGRCTGRQSHLRRRNLAA